MFHFDGDFLIFDGAMGTMLQRNGLAPGELPEQFNLTAPDVVSAIHRAYVEAGSDVVSTNTFGANALKLGDQVEAVVGAGVRPDTSRWTSAPRARCWNPSAASRSRRHTPSTPNRSRRAQGRARTSC